MDGLFADEAELTADAAFRLDALVIIDLVADHVDGIEAESLLIALDLEGVAISTGSACSSGTLEPSHVLQAMGLPTPRTRNSLRFSLGRTTTGDDVDRVLTVLPEVHDRASAARAVRQR